MHKKIKPCTQEQSTDQRNPPIARGIASNWKVLVRPNLSANAPPVNEPTVAPASSTLTIHPVHGFCTHENHKKTIDGAYSRESREFCETKVIDSRHKKFSQTAKINKLFHLNNWFGLI